MKRTAMLFLCVLTAVFASFAAVCVDDAPAQDQKPEAPVWHAEKARFRLTVEEDRTDTWMFLDDRVLCLPCGMETGVEIYDEAGKKQKFYRFASGGIQFDQTKEPRKLYVYFGFPAPENGKQPPGGGLGRKIQNDPLILRQAGVDYGLAPEDWRQYMLDQAKKKAKDEKAEEKDREAAAKRAEELEAMKDNPQAAEDGIEADLKSKFGADTTDIRPGNTFLDHRIYEAYEKIAVAFKGGLVVPESGDYEFRITTNATRILSVDGKTLVRSFGESDNPASNSASIHLEAGSHPFLAIYHRRIGDFIFSVEWKRPGDADFSLLTERDFSPAPPVRVLKLEDRDGGRYPLCRQDARYVLHLDKMRRAALRELSSLDGASAGCRIEAGGKVFSPDQVLFVTPDDSEEEIGLIPPEGSGLSRMSFRVRPVDKRFFPIDPAVRLTLWAPLFLYDDETLELTREIRSRIPAALPLELEETRTSAKENGTPVAELRREVLPVPDFRLGGFDRFAQDIALKESRPLDGAETARSPLDLAWTVGLPGFTFDSAEFAVVPAGELKDFTVGEDGLRDHDGKRRIVPLLHRPTLHELRAWELPKAIASGLTPVRTVLAAAEDRDGFGEVLKAEFKRHGVELEFFPWKRSQSGRDTLESLPDLVKAIRTTHAGRILIVPPSTSRRLILSTREESRIAAFLLQIVHDSSHLSGAVLTPPVVFDADESAPRRDRELTAELRAFQRMYGAEFLELAHVFEAAAKDDALSPAERNARLARCIVHAFLNLRSAED